MGYVLLLCLNDPLVSGLTNKQTNMRLTPQVQKLDWKCMKRQSKEKNWKALRKREELLLKTTLKIARCVLIGSKISWNKVWLKTFVQHWKF